ncbi:MAG: hypothetical protein ACYDGY_07965 [Acidimicrobiales bacterium]
MTSLHIDVTDEIGNKLAHRAESAGITSEEIAVQAVESFVAPRHSLPFASLGSSGTHDTAERAEEILYSDFGE